MAIGKEEAKDIVLNSLYSYHRECERDFHVEFEVRDKNLHEFEEGFIIYASSKDPANAIIGMAACVVEKEGGEIIVPRTKSSIPGRGPTVEDVIKAYRENAAK